MPPPPAPYGTVVYPTQHWVDATPFPDADDDDDITSESGSDSSDDNQWAMEESVDPTPDDIVGCARELGLQCNTDPTPQQADHVIREAYFRMRRAKRFYRKATGRRYSKKGGRFRKHTFRRQKRRGDQGHAKGGYFQKRKRGHFIPHKGKRYWVDMEHVPEEAVEAYFKRGSNGRKNPRGRDGNIMLCHECGSDEHLIAKCPRKSSSIHFANNQEIITPNGVMHYATPAYVHAGATQTSVPHGSTGDSGLQAAPHEQPTRTTEMNEDPSITGDYDPSFQLILRRHGLIAMPRDVDPDHEWTEIQEFGDTSISRPSSLLHDPVSYTHLTLPTNREV